MSEKTNLVYEWARSIKGDAEKAAYELNNNFWGKNVALNHIGQIIGACEAIMETTKQKG